MTPYWPSPLGATHRRLTRQRDTQNVSFSGSSYASEGQARRFPKPTRRVTWVADADLDLPGTSGDEPLPEAG